MKLQDVILKAMAKKLSWIEAAEIAGMSVRNMQRMRQRYIEHGYTGLFDQRRGKRSIHRIPMETAERVLALYRDKYSDVAGSVATGVAPGGNHHAASSEPVSAGALYRGIQYEVHRESSAERNSFPAHQPPRPRLDLRVHPSVCCSAPWEGCESSWRGRTH